MPLEAQVKLLRVLQSGEIQPIGARHARQVDVRVIAATNKTLLDEVAAGRFREDLYYRLNVVQVTIPPLRERLADVPALARHLLARIAQQPGLRPLGITDDALALLVQYDWPGNVRQLQNALFPRRGAVRGRGADAGGFPADRLAGQSPAGERGHGDAVGRRGDAVPARRQSAPAEDIEADVIRLAIGHYRGRMTEVARRLGIGRSTLYRKLGELGIDNAAA